MRQSEQQRSQQQQQLTAEENGSELTQADDRQAVSPKAEDGSWGDYLEKNTAQGAVALYVTQL